MKKCVLAILAITITTFYLSAQGNKVKISGKDDVIYIIDGEKMSKDSSISMLDANDIESIKVLKGDAAMKEYGESGVIIIATKDSKKRKLKDDGGESTVEVYIEDADGDDNRVYVTGYTRNSDKEKNPKTFYNFTTGDYHSNDDKLTYDYSRLFKGDSFEKDYKIVIDKNLKSLSIKLSGSLEEGETKISLKDPNGKSVISSFEIDQYGSVSLRKKIKDSGANILAGEWILRIEAKEAKGNFKISMEGN
jgi:hypothetical protein